MRKQFFVYLRRYAYTFFFFFVEAGILPKPQLNKFINFAFGESGLGRWDTQKKNSWFYQNYDDLLDFRKLFFKFIIFLIRYAKKYEWSFVAYDKRKKLFSR